MREAQTMAAPALSPAPRSPMPEFPMGTQFLREAGSTGRTNAAYVKRAELIGELERARAVVEQRQRKGERPFQIDLETVAAIEAELTALMAENPELQN